MKTGGVIAFDNTLWSGKVLLDTIDLEKDDREDREDTEALRKLNDKLVNDTKRVHVVQLNIGDGYTLATKL